MITDQYETDKGYKRLEKVASIDQFWSTRLTDPDLVCRRREEQEQKGRNLTTVLARESLYTRFLYSCARQLRQRCSMCH